MPRELHDILLDELNASHPIIEPDFDEVELEDFGTFAEEEY